MANLEVLFPNLKYKKKIPNRKLGNQVIESM